MSTALWILVASVGPLLMLAGLLVRSQTDSDQSLRPLRICGHRVLRFSVYGVLLLVQPFQHAFATLAPNAFATGANVGSSMLFPLSLSILLYLYVTRKPGEFIRVIFLIAGMNAMVVTTACAIRSGWIPTGLDASYAELWSRKATWEITLGTLSTISSALLMVSLVRAWGIRSTSRIAYVAFPLLMGLTFDSAFFAAVLAGSRGWVNYPAIFLGQLASKWLIGGIYALGLAFILRPVELNRLVASALPFRQFLSDALLAIRPFPVSGLSLAFWRDKGRSPKKSKLRKDSASMLQEVEERLSDDSHPARKPAAIERGPDSACSPQRIAMRRRALRAIARRWPELVKSHRDQWVAVDQTATPIHVAASFRELWNRMNESERIELFPQRIADSDAPAGAISVG